MRNAVKEYIEYSSEEKNNLWNTATFVFDTNVFLNLYRYSNKTRNQLIESFEWLKARIWMPYQVASEFCKDRYSVIDEANRRFICISLFPLLFNTQLFFGAKCFSSFSFKQI